MVYGADDMLHVEIETTLWKLSQFIKKENEIGLKCMVDLIDEVRKTTHVLEFTAKHRATRRYNLKLPREMHEGDMVLKEVVLPAHYRNL